MASLNVECRHFVVSDILTLLFIRVNKKIINRKLFRISGQDQPHLRQELIVLFQVIKSARLKKSGSISHFLNQEITYIYLQNNFLCLYSEKYGGSQGRVIFIPS